MIKSIKIGFSRLIFRELDRLSQLKCRETTYSCTIIFSRTGIFSRNSQKFSAAKISDYTVGHSTSAKLNEYPRSILLSMEYSMEYPCTRAVNSYESS